MDRSGRAASGWPLVVIGLAFGLAGGIAVGLHIPLRDPPRPAAARIGGDGLTAASQAALGPAAAPGPATVPARRFAPDRPLAERVLIVTIDGLRPDLLAVADAPNVRGLAAAASYTFWAQTVADPYVYTLPAHVSLLTGVNPDRHGVTWNGYIEESYPAVPTLFELAKARGLTTAMVSGKMKFIALNKPGTLDHVYLPPDEPVPDALVARQAVNILHRHRPNVMFVHLPGVDTAGHASGWGSPLQRAAVTSADAALGEVLAGLASAGLAAGTVIILTADHGGAGLSHEPDDPRSRTIPWIATGPGIRKGADLTRDTSLTVRAEDTFATACGVLGIPLPAHAEGAFVEQILEGRELLHTTAPAR